MKIQNHAPYQLSNYEVLNHILSVQEDLEEQASHRYREKARSDAELLLKYPMEKEFRKPDEPDPPRPEDFPVQTDELKELEEQAKRRGDIDAARWMSERVIKYLGNWYMPTYRQHAEGIFAMVHDLQDLDMSKGEILQVVNTIPTSEVEVYTCIQGLEERYPSDEEQADFYANVLHIVNTHTSADADDGLPERTEQYPVPAKGSGVMMHQGNGDMEEEEAMAMNGGAGAYGEEEYAEGEGEGEYYQEDDGMMGGDDYVHEAEWGADKEGGVDDDVPEMD